MGKTMAFLGNLFGNSTGDSIDKAQDYYQQGMGQAQGELEQHEATGRGDIQEGLSAAQQYGAPYRGAGESALQSYMGSLGIGDSAARRTAEQAFQTSPGYQFALQEGLKGIKHGLAPRGLLGSGREAKELSRYATGLASQEYGNWQSQLSNLAGAGQTGAEQAAQRESQAGSSLANLGMGYGGTLADLYGQMAQSRAEGELAKAQVGQQRGAGVGSLLGAGIGGAVGGWPGARAGAGAGGLLGSLF